LEKTNIRHVARCLHVNVKVLAQDGPHAILPLDIVLFQAVRRLVVRNESKKNNKKKKSILSVIVANTGIKETRATKLGKFGIPKLANGVKLLVRLVAEA